MRYKKLQLENFRTFEGKHEFVFPDSKTLVIIHAVNGTGKSAMLLCYELCFVWRSYKSEVFKR